MLLSSKSPRDRQKFDSSLVRFSSMINKLISAGISNPALDNEGQFSNTGHSEQQDIAEMKNLSPLPNPTSSISIETPIAAETNESQMDPQEDPKVQPVSAPKSSSLWSRLEAQAGNAWHNIFSNITQASKPDNINKSSSYPPNHVGHLTDAPRENMDLNRIAKIPRLERTDTIPSALEYQQFKTGPKPNFIHREVRSDDMRILRALHIDLFPVAYNDGFYDSILKGEIPTSLICWVKDEQSLDSSSNPIVAFACRSPEFDSNDEMPHPVGAEVARKEIVTVIQHLACEQALEALKNEAAPVAESSVKELVRILTKEIMAPEAKALDKLTDQTEYILTLGVMQEFWKKGLASQLISLLQRDAIKRGKKIIMLHVVDYNKPALDMYTKSGFNILDYYENYYSFLDQRHASYLAAWVSSAESPIMDNLVFTLAKNTVETLKSMLVSAHPPHRDEFKVHMER